MMRHLLVAVVMLTCVASFTLAQTTIDGRDMALRSSGVDLGKAWLLDENGYVGTYVRVAEAGPVTVTAHASGRADRGESARMQIAVGDAVEELDTGAGWMDYARTFELQAGLHFVRIGFINDAPDASRELTIDSVTIDGAGVDNANTDANALAAADSYIANYRRGRAKVQLPGAGAGETAQVKLKRHAFNFACNVPSWNNRFIPEVTQPGSVEERFQQFVLANFNMIVPSNAGKWAYQEGERDGVTMADLDRLLNFAEANGLRVRMHTLLWENQQEPDWVTSTEPDSPGLLTRARRGDEAAKAELTEEIDERIAYYVRDRAGRIDEMDVLNESLHRRGYLDVYGVDGVAEIFNKTAAAVDEAGADTRLYLNEYNVIQWSRHPQGTASDPYANWYRAHGEQLLRAGAEVDGFGVQYYCDGRTKESIGSGAHSPARIMGAFQNLSLTGLHISLTEFEMRRIEDQSRAADIVEQLARMVFGTANADTFMIWAVWAGAAGDPTPASALANEDWTPTEPGQRWAALMDEWDTDEQVTVADDGTIEFVGFYGDYEVEVGGNVYELTLVKGVEEYEVR